MFFFFWFPCLQRLQQRRVLTLVPARPKALASACKNLEHVAKLFLYSRSKAGKTLERALICWFCQRNISMVRRCKEGLQSKLCLASPVVLTHHQNSELQKNGTLFDNQNNQSFLMKK